MNNKRRKILIIRFSAMGDVAMTAPIVQQIAKQNPEVDFLLLSRPFFKPFFSEIENLDFYAFSKEKHKGLNGLYSLFRELKSFEISGVADLHFNLRSRIIGFFFKIIGVDVAHLNKGRAEKKALTRKNNKVLKPLLPMWERYAQVFEKLNLKAEIIPQLINQKHINEVGDLLSNKATWFNVGISPFAQHLQKVYPLEKMEQVISELDKANIQTFIFGGGEEEKSIAESWEAKFANSNSTIGKFTLEEELKFIAQLDIMISMDSAGMHLASLKGIKVLSIWGATHPFAGFLGFGQSEDNCIQADLYCRPCSVYGNKPCFRGDLACMYMIEPKTIVNKILMLLQNG